MEKLPPIPDELSENKINQSHQEKKMHPKAEAALVCGITGIFITPLAFVAIVFGHIARSEIQSDESLKGKNQAVIGLILGYLVLSVVLACVILILAQLFWPAGHKASKESTETFSFLPVKSVVDEDITTIIYDGEKFIAALKYGRLMTSVNGINWEISLTDIGDGVDSLLYGNSKIIAVSGQKLFVYDDNRYWKEMDEKVPEPVGRLIWTGNEFVGSIEKGILVSSDCINWEKKMIPGVGGVPEISGDAFQITADYHGRLFVTKDFISWEEIETPRQKLITIWRGQLWASHHIDSLLYTYKKSKWEHILSPPASGVWSGAGTDSIIVSGNYLMALGENFSWTNDGYNWGSVKLPHEYSYMYSVAYGDGRFVLVGDFGKIYIGIKALEIN